MFAYTNESTNFVITRELPSSQRGFAIHFLENRAFVPMRSYNISQFQVPHEWSDCYSTTAFRPAVLSF